MVLSILKQAIAGVVDGASMADAGQHVLQGPALGHMVVDIVARQQRYAAGAAQPCQVFQPGIII